jgi:hypothetical protein
MKMKTGVRRGHPKRHFPVATARRTAKVHAEGNIFAPHRQLFYATALLVTTSK